MNHSEPTDTPSRQLEDVVEAEVDKRSGKELLTNESRRGVVFMSRVPPRMTVPEVRSILSKIGPVDRIWLEPEDKESRKIRIKEGGSRRRRMKHGWIEFIDKSQAKLAVELLNNKPIGASTGLRRKPFSDDLWTLKYLKGFKWHHLVEEQVLEHKEKNKRWNLEMSQMARERDFYISRVEKAKYYAKIKARRSRNTTSNESHEESSARDVKQRSFYEIPSLTKERKKLDAKRKHFVDSSNDVINKDSQCAKEPEAALDQILHRIFRK
eukprot:jgi/Galph1/4422/GphlegSOOS_G3064.1